MPVVIDTRFLVEHFYSNRNEIRRKTTYKLRELIKQKEGILPTIVISEVVRITCERRGIEEAKLRYFSLVRSGLQIHNLDAEVAKQAGLLKCRYRNIPMGDCIIAAIALKEKASILSDDPHFSHIRNVRCIWI
ncbi:hypothetical protein CP083_07235 [Candidatus Bathyarchaeota archaeon B24-2]|nr:MAG: hypothetical protein CP083_07235 [Candidatus Bathyarchaeota archaeon B24-2]